MYQRRYTYWNFSYFSVKTWHTRRIERQKRRCPKKWLLLFSSFSRHHDQRPAVPHIRVAWAFFSYIIHVRFMVKIISIFMSCVSNPYQKAIYNPFYKPTLVSVYQHKNKIYEIKKRVRYLKEIFHRRTYAERGERAPKQHIRRQLYHERNKSRNTQPFLWRDIISIHKKCVYVHETQHRYDKKTITEANTDVNGDFSLLFWTGFEKTREKCI